MKHVIVHADWGHKVPDRFMEKLFMSDDNTARIGPPPRWFESVEEILEWWGKADRREREDGFDDVLNSLEVLAGGKWCRVMWADGAIVAVEPDEEMEP